MHASRERDTRTVILDVAQRLVQSQGFSGFSYADVAARVGIRKASIHHHFPTKGNLGTELMTRYRAAFGAALARIDTAKGGSRAKLQRYAKLFADVLRDGNRLCMCGMLAADFDALPKSVRVEVAGFFDDNEEWLAAVLAQGRDAKELDFQGPPRAHARLILCSFEGAMLVARSHGDVARFEDVVRRVLDQI